MIGSRGFWWGRKRQDRKKEVMTKQDGPYLRVLPTTNVGKHWYPYGLFIYVANVKKGYCLFGTKSQLKIWS